jgi:hypothetical protein
MTIWLLLLVAALNGLLVRAPAATPHSSAAPSEIGRSMGGDNSGTGGPVGGPALPGGR